MMKIVFCKSTEYIPGSSWFSTYKKIKDEFSRKIEVVGEITYELNIVFQYLIRIYSYVFYCGGGIARVPAFKYISERKFLFEFSKLKEKGDLYFHVAEFCIPAELENQGIHVSYQDASMTGYLKYAECNDTREISLSFLESHVKISKQYYDRMKAIFTFNEWTRQCIINDFNVSKHKVFNVGFGLDIEPFRGEKDYSKRLMLIVLRKGIERWKGLPLLLQAFKIAKGTYPDLRLAVVGTDLGQGVEGVETYIGYPREKTLELFREATLFAMPAIFEPNGMVYLEALANKTPILGLRKFAFPEFAGNGQYGFIVDHPDPEQIAAMIVTAYSDPQTLRLMGIRGQEFVTGRYAWPIVSEKILEVISKISLESEKFGS